MILFSDYDDTLFPHGDDETYAKNLRAVKGWRKAGHQFCLATGRALPSLKRAFPDYNDYCDFVVLENGAICLHPDRGTTFKRAFADDLVQEVWQYLQSEDRKHQFAYVFYADLGEWPEPRQDVTQFRCWVKSDDDATRLAKKLNQKYAGRVKVFPMYCAFASSIPWIHGEFPAYLEVVPVTAGKNAAISDCAKDESRIITIGDGINDIEMIQSFEGYTVANAQPEVLQAVAFDQVVPDVASLIVRLLAESE